MHPRARLGLSTLPLLALLAVGCGGHHRSSSASSARSTLHLSVEWPDRNARFVPYAANSIVAVVKVGTQQIARTLLRRPTDVRSFTSTAQTDIDMSAMPVGDATVTMTAYPESDGTGTAQAAGTQTIHLIKDGTASVDATLMASTAVRATLAPRDEPNAASLLFVRNGGYVPNLLATGYDAQDRMVLLETHDNPEIMAWTSDDPTMATVNGAGDVEGLVAGTTTIRVAVNVGGAAPILASFPVDVKEVASSELLGGGSIEPNATAQLTFVMHFTDGTSKDFTASSHDWTATGAGLVSATGLFSWGPNYTGASTVSGWAYGHNAQTTMVQNP